MDTHALLSRAVAERQAIEVVTDDGDDYCRLNLSAAVIEDHYSYHQGAPQHCRYASCRIAFGGI